MRLLPILLLTGALAQAATVPGVSSEQRWKNAPAFSKTDDAGNLAIAAGKSTDWFISPFDGQGSATSPVLLFKADAEFSMRAKVTVKFGAPWDAGCLVVYSNDATWAKLCLEMTRWNEPTIVSVVTQGRSDDNNSIAITGESVYLKIAKSGQAFIFYSSTDGHAWRMARAFHFSASGPLEAGFSSQSPQGVGCRARFSEIRYTPKPPADFWTGE